MVMRNKSVDEIKTKNEVLEVSKRLVPGTTSIDHCGKLEYCMNSKMRLCGDIKNLCIPCSDGEKIIGGLSFLFNVAGSMGKENGIAIYRYGQEGSYAKMFEGNGMNDIMEKVEKDEVIKEITERTKFIMDERREADDQKVIEAFKRHTDQSDNATTCILVVRKNSDGEYGNLDNELIKIAKKKEKSGKKIKIIDESEMDRKIYVLGISSKKILKKLELDAKTINDADNRVHIFVIPTSRCSGSKISTHNQPEYAGILAIISIDDDAANVNDKKDRWKKYFTEKYKALHFIGTETLKLDI